MTIFSFRFIQYLVWCKIFFGMKILKTLVFYTNIIEYILLNDNVRIIS